MPLNFLATVYVEGRKAIPFYDTLKWAVPLTATITAMKYYFAGPRIQWDRELHGKVYIVTGGTSGLGLQTVRELAKRGAQIIILVRKVDEWVADLVDMLREDYANPLVFAEQCDLARLESVQEFATKWINNMPARRLDGVLCCAAETLPPGAPLQLTPDGVECQFQVCYLSHFLLLTVLAPALRAQPPDRDVRIVLVNCLSAVMADLKVDDLGFEQRRYPSERPFLVQGEAKLCLSLFGYELQRQFDSYQRKDGTPPNVHVAVVDPGLMRSPSFKRFVTCGKVLMLFVYLYLWPIWWLFLKSSVDGSQSVLMALLSPEIPEQTNATYISNVRIRPPPPRSEFKDEELQKKLFTETQNLLKRVRKPKDGATAKTTSAKPAASAKTTASASAKAREQARK